MNKLKLLCAILMMSLLFGCGNGKGTSGGATSINTTVYNTGGQDPLTTGETHTIGLTGNDTAGGSYSGTIQSVVDGPTTIDGRDVIQERIVKNLTRTGTATASSTETVYYNTDKTLYKIEYSSGRSATPTNNFQMPATVKVGDSGEGQGLAYGNSDVETSTWLVTDGGGGNATLTFSFYLNSKLEEQHMETLTPTGYAPTFTYVLYNFPAPKMITTLYGKYQLLGPSQTSRPLMR